MDRLEILDCWDSRSDRPVMEILSRRIKYRVSKRIARWTGKPQKRETKLFWGQAMTIVYPEFVSTKIGRFSYFETDMTSMFIDVLRPGMTVYDVGSHFGYFSLLASEIVGPSGRVFAFEPTAGTFNVLQENAARRENISCLNMAAYRETGELTFLDQGLNQSALNFIVGQEQLESESASATAKLIKVPAVKLDEFAAERGYPDFIKIDAEGAEAPILEGMTEIIRRVHPGIGLEMGDQVCQRTGNSPCRENIELLMDHGYEVFDYQGSQAKRHEIQGSYRYDNLFFRHPEWAAMQSVG